MTGKKPGSILYDGACPVCLKFVRTWEKVLRRRGFDLVPLQEEWVRKRLALPEEELLKEMRVLTSDKKVFGAIDAYVFVWRRIWWCLPLWLLAHVPGIRFLMDCLYRWVAKNRMCISGSCSIGSTKQINKAKK